MKKALFVLFTLCLLLLCACKSDSPTVVGSWDAEASILGAENDAESIRIIFYDGMEGEETHTKNGTTYKTYAFDYTVEDSILTIYVGENQTAFTVSYGEANGTKTMTLTAEDGTAYSYTLASRITPGIRQ